MVSFEMIFEIVVGGRINNGIYIVDFCRVMGEDYDYIMVVVVSEFRGLSINVVLVGFDGVG